MVFLGFNHLILFLLLAVYECQSSGRVKPTRTSLLMTALPRLVSPNIPTTNIGDFSNSCKDEYTIISNDIEFKYYRPSGFHKLRSLAGFGEENYRNVMQSSQFFDMVSDSKSGQSFLRSADGQIVVKTIKKEECKMMCTLIDPLVQHIVAANHTCLNNMLGLYRVKAGKVICYILVSRNIFYIPEWKNQIPQLLLDIKGSMVGRHKSEKSMVLKDGDLIGSGITLDVSQPDILNEALQNDINFLSKFGLMDYSLLICKSVLSPPGSVQLQLQNPELIKCLQMNKGPLVLQCLDGSSQLQCGIVDFLQSYNRRKRWESFFKSLYYDRCKISCIAPQSYGNRLVDFVRSRMSKGSEVFQINH